MALLSLLFISSSCCQREAGGKLIFIDRDGNILGKSFINSQPVMVAYRDEETFRDKVGFQLYYFSDNNGWKLISLVSRKPDDPVLEIAEDLHIEDLPPGKYKINLIVNDKDISEASFNISQDW